jgi:hypothetical protein
MSVAEDTHYTTVHYFVLCNSGLIADFPSNIHTSRTSSFIESDCSLLFILIGQMLISARIFDQICFNLCANAWLKVHFSGQNSSWSRQIGRWPVPNEKPESSRIITMYILFQIFSGVSFPEDVEVANGWLHAPTLSISEALQSGNKKRITVRGTL